MEAGKGHYVGRALGLGKNIPDNRKARSKGRRLDYHMEGRDQRPKWLC